MPSSQACTGSAVPREHWANEDGPFLMKTQHFGLCSGAEWDLIKGTFSRMHLCIMRNCSRQALHCESWEKVTLLPRRSWARPWLLSLHWGSIHFQVYRDNKRGNPSIFFYVNSQMLFPWWWDSLEMKPQQNGVWEQRQHRARQGMEADSSLL